MKKKFDFELISLGLLILLIPVMMHSLGRSFLPLSLVGKFQLTELAFSLLFICWMTKIIRRKVKFKFTFVYIPLMVYICSSLISFKNSKNLTESAVEFIGILYLAVLFVLLVNVISSKERFYFAINMWLLTSILVASAGMLGVILAYVFKLKTFLIMEYDTFPYLGHIFRVRSTFMPNAKFLSSYLTIGAPLAFWQFVSSRDKREKFLWLVCLGLFFATLIFTFSRGWLGLAISLYLISMKIQNSTVSLKIFRRLLLVFIIIFGIFIILASLWEPVDLSFEQFYDKEAQVIEYGSMMDPELGLRRIQIGFGLIETRYSMLKKVSLKMFKEHPFAGVGLGTFRNELIRFKNTGQLPERFPVLDPHCTILGKAAESGMFGLISLIFLWGYIIKQLLYTYRVSADKKTKLMVWTLFSVTVAFAIQSIDMDIMNFRFLWFLFALGIASRNLLNRIV